MKGLKQFMEFRLDDFLKEKKLVVIGCRKWLDSNGKDVLGTKVDTVILVDNTDYMRKDGTQISNRFEKLTLKVRKDIEFPIDSVVKPVDGRASVYGDYQNQLAITCKDVVAVPPSGKA